MTKRLPILSSPRRPAKRAIRDVARALVPLSITAAALLGACSSSDGTTSAPSGANGSSPSSGDAASGGAGSSSGGSPATGGPGSEAGASEGADGSPASCGDAPLTQWETMMLDKHNEWRASVSPPAAGMNRVYWDRAIAANAAKWVASCDPDWPHSPESSRTNVGGYDILGENLAYCGGPACAPIAAVTDGSGLGDGEGWWSERTDYDWSTGESAGLTAHYTQMVSSNVYAIGCATQKCGAPGPSGWNGTWWWTICQYGPRGQAYWTGTKPYEAGSGGLAPPPASVFEQHPGLCKAP